MKSANLSLRQKKTKKTSGAGLESREDLFAELRARIVLLEAERSIRKIVCKYMALCDEPCVESGSLSDLFTANAVWKGAGAAYAKKFGTISGRENIVAFLGAYLGKGRHFLLNTHFLTSDSVTVSADAKSAWGTWVMLQVSSYVSGGAEILSARLKIDFVSENGKWQISRFTTTRLFAAPWDPAGLSSEQDETPDEPSGERE